MVLLDFGVIFGLQKLSVSRPFYKKTDWHKVGQTREASKTPTSCSKRFCKNRLLHEVSKNAPNQPLTSQNCDFVMVCIFIHFWCVIFAAKTAKKLQKISIKMLKIPQKNGVFYSFLGHFWALKMTLKIIKTLCRRQVAARLPVCGR